jgi:Ca2+-binding EF-hand superfamily protein
MRFSNTFVVVSMIVASFLTNARADEKKHATTPSDKLTELRDAAKAGFKLVDSNNDGLISQKEAVDAGNMLVGGFFFRADANGDGKLTKEEAKQARENLLNQRPLLRFIFERTEQETAQQGDKEKIDQVGRNLMNTVDTNHDGSLDAAELRQAVQTGVQSLFLTADRNGDGQLDTSELNGAVVEVGRAGIQAAFQTADADKNGAVSRDEFDKAILKPANVIFRLVDANNDGQLTKEELRTGAQLLLHELKNLEVAEPANSLPDQIQKAIEAGPAVTTAPAPATTAPAVVRPQ